jgi:gliding motility-associated-like protein
MLRQLTFSVICLACGFASLKSQLVNGSFESSTEYPTTTGQWQLVSGWNNAGSLVSTPDFFHYLGSNVADLPETPVALVSPYEGNAVMGLLTTGVKFSNVREYLSTQFAQPLEAGREYLVGFKITNGVTSAFSNSGLGTSQLGLYFSTEQPVQPGGSPLMVVPQFTIDTVLFSREWVDVNLVFEATAGFTHMTFGVFGTDNDKEIIPVEGDHPQFSYYFLDNFYLEEVPVDFDPTEQDPDKNDHNNPKPQPDIVGASLQDFYVPNTFTPDGDGNNDVFNPVSSSVDRFELKIYSRWGNCIFKSADTTRGWDGFYEGRKAETGAYVWEIEYIDANDREELERKVVSGVVYLIQ